MHKKRTCILAFIMAVLLLAMSVFGCIFMIVTDVHVTGDHLSERIEDLLSEADESDPRSSNNIQEVRMAQLVEYEIPHMEEDEIFIVVKTEDGAIARTIINKPLAEALAKHYK